MKAEDSRSYPSTRFTLLTDAGNNVNARRNYFICFTIATVFICITTAYVCYKSFIAPAYFNDQNPLLGDRTDHPKYSELKLYNPKPALTGFRRKTSKDHRELTCEESQQQSEAIPGIFIREILEKNFENVHDYVNLDLLLHYENIINRHGAGSLKKIFNEYQQELSQVKTSGDFLNFLRILKSNKFKFYVNYLKEDRVELKQFENFFSLTAELNHWYNYLSGLSAFLSRYDQQKLRKYVANCTEETFEKFTEDTQKRISHFAHPFNITDKKLQEVNEVINDWAQPVKIVFDNTSLVFYGKVLLLSELNREIRRLNISCLKSAYFLAGHTLYLDEDVELLGVDLAIISPKWIFLKQVKINLNGVDGVNTAESAAFGQPGKPGNPGGNAGDFLGVGNPQEKLLRITANGGKGGNGQNGAKGQNGANNTQPDPPVDRPRCTAKVKTLKNSFGQNITHYKIFSNSGCGGSGTDGGVKGQGGTGGVITLISGNSMKVTTGLNGTAGSPGKGGAGGVGGRDGCFYEVLDINDEILHRVTRVKCVSGNTLPAGEFGRDNHNTEGQVFPPVKEYLKLQKCLHQFLQFTGGDFNSDTISVLKQLSQFNTHTPPDIKDILLEFKLLETIDKVEFYEVFLERINKYIQQPSSQPVLKYLRSILLGRITVLKPNINYFFIDLKNYLNIIKTDIRTANERTREFQSSVYLKRKVEVKREQIKQNLNQIRFRLAVGSHTDNHTNCVLMKTIDMLQSVLIQISEAEHPESNFPLRSCSLNPKIDAENNRETPTEASLTNVLRILENVPSKEGVRGHLEKLKDALCVAKDSDVLSEEEKNLLEALTDEVEHFIALYYFVDWEELENLFLKSLQGLTSDVASELEYEDVGLLKQQLIDVIIGVQYRLATDAARQSLYPFSNRSSVPFFQSKSPVEDVLTEITLLEDSASQGTAPLCRNHLKAVFDENSAMGEFYFWPNSVIRNSLKMLFSGAEISLKANVINRHVFDKNFVQFTSLKLEFECSRNGDGCQEELNGILNNFKVEMTHSGYSYYSWKEETRIVVSERISLEYSFRMVDVREPEIYNALYKKCQNGEIKLSPFTTWSVRLLPLNDEADFKKLLSYADVVNLRLTGSGTYTA